jgi:small subunit ribosomal protein S20e
MRSHDLPSRRSTARGGARALSPARAFEQQRHRSHATRRGRPCRAGAGASKAIQLRSHTPFPLSPLPAVCSDLKRQAEDNGLKGKVTGPVRLPTRTLRITTRKTPCGEGSKTWDHFELRVHKRLIDLKAPTEVVKKITAITIEPGVEVEVIVADK